MRYLGIDYGTKRIGIAISDENGGYAFPETILENNKLAIPAIVRLMNERGVGRVVLGESKNLDGTPNPLMEKINYFKKKLETEIAPMVIDMHPEFLTSHQASHFAPKGEAIDASAAAIMLQAYLDKEKFKK